MGRIPSRADGGVYLRDGSFRRATNPASIRRNAFSVEQAADVPGARFANTWLRFTRLSRSAGVSRICKLGVESAAAIRPIGADGFDSLCREHVGDICFSAGARD